MDLFNESPTSPAGHTMPQFADGDPLENRAATAQLNIQQLAIMLIISECLNAVKGQMRKKI